MVTSSIRVLVVEDFEWFRRFVCATLEQRPDLQIICEVSDGVEAVQKAEELQPDLVLLDIGLPKLNGIEAARRVCKLSPQSKILFVSQQTSTDVVQAALATGARGYILKTDAGSELLTAVNAVLRGERFVSSRFAGHDFRDATDSQDPDGLSGNRLFELPALTLPRKAESTRRHEVEFYSDDTSLLHGFTQFIGAALTAGNAVIVVATGSHRDKLLLRLQAHGLDISAEIAQGRYISLDAADTLSTFMINEMPDPVRFMEAAGNLIMAAAKFAKGEHPRVAICGECEPPLWTLGLGEAAIRFEQLWNEIAKSYDVDILCGYPLGSFHGEQHSHIFQRICAEHSAIHSQ